MLFDLRSPGRRRVIKTVYLFLAVLIGVGLIGFGVGTGGNFGGLLSAAGNGGAGGGTAAGDKVYINEYKKAKKQANAAPNDVAAWLKYGTAAYAVATLPDNYSSSAGGYTATGHHYLDGMKVAWTHYLALTPNKVNNTFAQEVVAAFGTTPGIGDWPTAESAEEVVVERSPTSYTDYEYLAYFAYEAKDATAGDQAAAKAVALAPKKQQSTIKTQLGQIRAAALGATGASGATGAT
jgi:hypothetical protein